MVDCPVCGTASPPEGPSCKICGLPVDLFVDLEAVAEVPAAALPAATVISAGVAEGASIVEQPQEPSTASEAASVPEDRVNGGAVRTRVAPAGPDMMAKRTLGLTDELLEVGQSLGLDVSALARGLQDARAEGSAQEAWKVRRELAPIIVSGLLDRYRQICRTRDELSGRSGTSKVDVELIGFRKALREGDIPRADRHRQVAEQELRHIEAAWTRIHARMVEMNQIVRELQELGGVAPSVLRQITDSLRLSGRPEPEPVEQRVVRANSTLWHMLLPRLSHELSRSRALLKASSVSLANAELIRSEIDRLTQHLRAHRVGEALETSKWLRLELVSATRRLPRAAVRRSFIE